MNIASDWQQLKLVVMGLTGLERDALHIYTSVAIQLAAALLGRRRLGDWLPWLVVLGFALLGEVGDVVVEVWPDSELQAGKALHDIVNTMVMPSILLLLSRWRPGLAGRSDVPSRGENGT